MAAHRRHVQLRIMYSHSEGATGFGADRPLIACTGNYGKRVGDGEPWIDNYPRQGVWVMGCDGKFDDGDEFGAMEMDV